MYSSQERPWHVFDLKVKKENEGEFSKDQTLNFMI